MAKTKTKTKRAPAKSALKGRKKSAAAARPKKARKAVTKRAGRRGSAAQQAGVTMTIDLGSGAPGDVDSIRRIDGKALSGPGTGVGAGEHTASWDVVSPTIRPIGFDVTITDDASGRKLLDRPGQKTGDDGKGAGAGTFTV
jgi:hypothetical protein